MRIKICGITTKEDALAAVSAGGDAIGVICHSPESPRNLPDANVRKIFSALPPGVICVCVTHTRDPDELQAVCRLSPDEIQINHPFPRSMVPASIRVVRVIAPGMTVPDDYDAVIVDASMGRGKKYDPAYSVFVRNTATIPFYLAGGLTPENVSEAVSIVRPDGVDVATGVELSPGMKDHAKIRAFIRAVRDAEVSVEK
ncbi:phosphoribosylanthranilate isomerase [Methanogenium organophilum]|uniref:N-(5'-phosphoribosyl)anthranilate isomerase n=1 Tax=Methanogenium organophilum TaxID=2199 RepID=A0A9X9T6U1_METOG|nr:phosphoribosylanthranilate isomerase [Methanogenium organophilum]WAI00683.1 phosphoribosylanthranilate isomerase [Methanogenium organophilum]